MNEKSVLTIRIPKELKKRLEVASSNQGVSLNQFALYTFTRELTEIENSSTLQNYLSNHNKDEILKNFDEAMTKVKKRRSPNWDKL